MTAPMKKRTPVLAEPRPRPVRTPVLASSGPWPAAPAVPRLLGEGEKKLKVPYDAYYTPPWAVEQCLDEILPGVLWKGEEAWKIVEPGAGGGAFVDGLRERYPTAEITAIDLDPKTGPWPKATHSVRGDFLDWSPPGGQRVDLVIGNPPFGLALEYVRHARDVSARVVFLLRQGFLSSADRCAFFRSEEGRPLVVYQLANRPIFTNPLYVNTDSDNSEYVFVVWGPNWTPPATTGLRWLPDVPVEKRRHG